MEKMFQLTSEQIVMVAALITEQDERHDFKEWLTFVNDKVLQAGQQNINQQYEGYFKKKITQDVDVDIYKETKGEFERLLIGIWQCSQQDKRDAAFSLVQGLLGMLWEWQFCNMLDKEHYLVHWFQKWEPLGAPRFATTGIEGLWGIGTPDVMFIVNKQWFFGGIKHVAASDGEYMLNLTDWERIQKLRKYKPPIPYYSIIHDSERLGKWATSNEWQDWFALNLDETVKPRRGYASGPTWTGEYKAYWFSKDWFKPLKEVLDSIRWGND